MLFFLNAETGVESAVGDFSSSDAVRYTLAPQGQEALIVRRLGVFIASNDTEYDEYGGIDLIAGVGLYLNKEILKTGRPEPDRIESIFGTDPIKSVSDMAQFATWQQFPDAAGTAIKASAFIVELHAPITLYGRHFERLSWLLADNFSSLTKHKFFADAERVIYS